MSLKISREVGGSRVSILVIFGWFGGRVGEKATRVLRDPLSPRRTGDADFPRPALLKALASGFRISRQTDQPQPRQVL
jgi:hypothetical protein